MSLFSGAILGALAVLGHRRWSERREWDHLLADLEEDPSAPLSLPDLPERITDNEEFLATVSDVARDCSQSIRAAAELSIPDGVDPVTCLVVSSHMVRLYKIFDAILSLHETGRFDAAPALSRTLIELVINMDFIQRAPDVDAAARGFVLHSVRERLNPLEHFEDRVKVPSDHSAPSDAEMRSFIASIRPVVRAKGEASIALARAAMDNDSGDPAWVFDKSVVGEYLNAWPSKIYERAKGTDVTLGLYKDWFARYSLATHANWVVMHEQDLLRPDDRPSTLNSYPNPLNVVDPASWALAAALRFARGLPGSDQLVLDLEQYLQFFVQAASLVPFFPGMTDEEIDRMIEASEADDDPEYD
jgi:hypothetical protein